MPLRGAAVDTVILGCTHYPLVAPMLQRMLGRGVGLVTSGAALARQGVQVHRGDTMLLHQAAGQVRLMTGRPAPLAAMRHALAAALDLGRGAPAGPEHS